MVSHVLGPYYSAGTEEDMLHHLEVEDTACWLQEDTASPLVQAGMAFDEVALVHTFAVAFVVDLELEVVAVDAQRQVENH